MPRRLRAPLGLPFGLPHCPGLKGTRFRSFFSVLSERRFFARLTITTPLQVFHVAQAMRNFTLQPMHRTCCAQTQLRFLKGDLARCRPKRLFCDIQQCS